MILAGAAAAALVASPGLQWCIALATARRANPRLIAAASLAAALLIVWRAADRPHAIALAAVAATGIVAAWIDAYQRRLPDVLVLPVYPAVAAPLLATADPDLILRAVLCAAAGIALLLAGHLAGQVGFGDVKLAGPLGMVLGWVSWQAPVFALIALAAIGGSQALAVLAMGRREFPLGPAMFLATATTLAIYP